ncbi:transposase family protein [Microtetraspora malaysiensis]|uniref:transposase family protein n=1 Tax=Microtetraspora malaysiensis TaxID=161358 RepID=UPI003D8B3C74
MRAVIHADTAASSASACSLLAIAAVAVLTGARSFTAVAEWAADAPQQVLALLGVRRDPLTGRYRPPHEATVRRALTAVDHVWRMPRRARGSGIRDG